MAFIYSIIGSDPIIIFKSSIYSIIYLYEFVSQNGDFLGSVGECSSCVCGYHVNVFHDKVGRVHETSRTFPRQHFDELLDVRWWFLVFGFILAQVCPNCFHFLCECTGVFSQLKYVSYKMYNILFHTFNIILYDYIMSYKDENYLRS